MLLKVFFDGSNQADSAVYANVGLACIFGTPRQWRSFERDWEKTLLDHKARYLHTTDVATPPNRDFSADGQKEWTKKERDAFLKACAHVCEQHTNRPKSRNMPGKEGLVPTVVVFPLDDFKRARDTNPRVPRSVNELSVVQAMARVHRLGMRWGVDFYDLIFDRNEPYKGHIDDRKGNRKARRQLHEMISKIGDISEADSKCVLGLQMADFYAWCFTQTPSRERKWQMQLLRQKRFVLDRYEYENIACVIPGAAEATNSWKLPPRRPTR